MSQRPKYKKQKYQTYRINVEENRRDLGFGDWRLHQNFNPKRKKLMFISIEIKSLCSVKDRVKRMKR